jgi:hypothetical protein
VSQQPPTPVADDAHATATELQQRAANDYAQAEAARQQQSNRDNT